MSRGAIRSILVATDLTAESDHVVRGAATLAKDAGASLHVVHAMEVLGRPLWEASTGLVRMQSLIHERHTRLYEQLQRVLPPGMPTGSTKIEYRAPAESIGQRARQVEADLIVMGAKRRSFASDYLLGRTIHRLVEESVAPCLVLRGRLPGDTPRILLPVAEEDVRSGLLATGARWLLRLREQLRSPAAADLTLLHVVKSPFDWRRFAEELTRKIRLLMDEPGFGEYFRLHRRIAWSRTPAREILRAADELEVDLIGMGVRGHGPLLRALLGSVSTEVLRHSTASVLLFPPRMGDRRVFQAVTAGEPAKLETGDLQPDQGQSEAVAAAGSVAAHEAADEVAEIPRLASSA